MTRRVAIIQTNYLPWKGYFDLLSRVDVVVWLDSVQSTKNDWRNRNIIRGRNGNQWLSVPIRHSTSLRIRDVEVADARWNRKHLRSVQQNYARAPGASLWMPRISEWFEAVGDMSKLSQINRFLLERIAGALEMRTRMIDVSEVLADAEHDALEPTDRLVEICRRLDARAYLSGPAARAYMQEAAWQAAGISLEWMSYGDYPEYPQLCQPFEHSVSILDVLLMTGEDAPRHVFPEAHPQGPTQ